MVLTRAGLFHAAPSAIKRTEPARGGPAPRTRSRGRGGRGLDRVFPPVNSAPGGDAGDRRRATADNADPQTGIACRLALQVQVIRFFPGQDARFEIIEHEVAVVGMHREDGVARTVRLAHDRYQKAARWHAGLHQPAALLQNIVLTVAHTVGVGPVFLNTPDFHVGTRHYGKIDRVVDLDQARPELASKRYRRLIRRLFATLLRNAPAKLVVTYRLGRRP